MNALGYVRRSKKSKRGEGDVSIVTQESAIRDYCAVKGWTVAVMIIHDGISGTKGKRFDEINNSFRDRCCSVAVVYNLDRLARDSASLIQYFRRLAAQGVEVHETTSGLVDFTRPLGKLVVAVRGAMDEFYANIVGEKTRDALQNLRSQGRRYSHIPPFGYEYIDGLMVESREEQGALATVVRCKKRGWGRYRTHKALKASGYVGRGGLSLIQKLLER